MAHTRAPAGATDPAVSGDGGRARRLAKLSLWMLVVFAAWTVVYIFLAGPVAESFGVGTGAQGYIEAWLPWIAVSLLWVAPLLAGAVLGGRALALGAGGSRGSGWLPMGSPSCSSLSRPWWIG